MIVRHRTARLAPRLSPRLSPLSSAFGDLDRTFEQLTTGLFSTESKVRLPEVDARWDRTEADGIGDTLVLTVDLPGVSAEAVDIDVAGRTLTISVETNPLQWTRSLQLPAALDPDKIAAHHRDGRLTVRIGAVDAPERRSITIDTAPIDIAPIDTSPANTALVDTDAAVSPQDSESTEISSGSDQPGA